MYKLKNKVKKDVKTIATASNLSVSVKLGKLLNEVFPRERDWKSNVSSTNSEIEKGNN